MRLPRLTHSLTCLRRMAAPGALIWIAACTQVPELDEQVPGHLRNAPYPALVPLDSALVPLPTPRGEAEKINKSLSARRDALKARARALNIPTVDDPDRERPGNGVSD